MNAESRIDAFAGLGEYLRKGTPQLQKVISRACEENPWFTPDFIRVALDETARLLEPGRLEQWLAAYPGMSFDPPEPRQVGAVLAGNIPLAGFHDFLTVLISGHRFTGKLSSKDSRLLPFMAEKLASWWPEFRERILFVENHLGRVDAIIATGSNNTSRYFEYYFGRCPHVFRKNRNGVAILNGEESWDDLDALADDVFLYFGLGCRNVAKLYVPEGYDFGIFYRGMEKYRHLIDHHKYANNYQYYRTVYLMNRIEHLDNGFLILKPDRGFSSPVSTLYYEYYRDPGEPEREINAHREQIQCIAAPPESDLPAVPFGQTQHPEPWDYADHVDTLIFLSNLYGK